MGSGKRILVVDDNEDLAVHDPGVAAGRRFRRRRWPATARRPSALHQSHPADVVITDLFMPDKDGIETIVELRKLSPQLKIVAISGWTSTQGSDYLQVAREIGATVTLQKPFDPQELSRVVRQLAA